MNDTEINDFTTTDFDFAAFLLTPGKDTPVPAEYVGCRAFRPIRDNAQPQRVNHYRFVFILRSMNGNTVETLKALEVDYTNGLCVVEPLVFMMKRKQLRALLDSRKDEARKAQEETD